MALNSIEDILQDIREGKMVILMDDEDRENEGDLIMAGECVQPEHINFMATEARGLICMPMSRERCERLNLPLMVQRNSGGYGTKFTVSIEAARGVTTGISAADRARTIQVAGARGASADDIVSPGHVFPLMAQQGGVLSRAGHTEAACDLATMAGFQSSGVICEVMNDDGTMARRPQLEEFADRHGLRIGTIAELIHYRTMNERTVERVDNYDLETEFGRFRLHTYRDSIQGEIHLALTMGEFSPGDPVLVRVHITDTLRDLLHAQYPGSHRWSLYRAMQRVALEGRGVIVLLNNGQDSYALEDRIHAFFESRAQGSTDTSIGSSGVYLTVGTGSQILRDLGVGKMKLLSAPIKFSGISGFDLEVVEYLPYDEDKDE